MAERLLRFRDLKERGIIQNWPTLKRWVDARNFPSGRYLGPGTRVWTEFEVDVWLASRPTVKSRPHRQSLLYRGGRVMADEHFGSGSKKGRGRAQSPIDLIDAMHEAAEAAQPITGRGVGYKLFTQGLIPSMALKKCGEVYRLLKEAREEGISLGNGLSTRRAS